MTAQAQRQLVTETRTAEQPVSPAPAPRSDRAKLAAAFRALGSGVDAGTAYQRTKQWFCAGGADWTRALSTARMPTGAAANDPVYAPRVTQRDVTAAATRISHRSLLAQGFRSLGHGTAPSVAYRDTKGWFRASGAEWTRALV